MKGFVRSMERNKESVDSQIVDLHIHTNYSDGFFSPEEIVKLCSQRNVARFSITDHNSIGGYLANDELLKNPHLIPGVELSAQYRQSPCHILGYFIDVHSSDLLGLLNKVKKSRMKANIKLLDALKHEGINIDSDARVLTSRRNIAAVMLREFPGMTIDLIVKKYLDYEKYGITRPYKPDLEETTQVIRISGGIAVLAHPMQYSRSDVLAMLNTGFMDGIECYHPKHGLEEICWLKSLAEDRNLCVTGGSDYHSEKNKCNVGCYIEGKSLFAEMLSLKKKVCHINVSNFFDANQDDSKQNAT